MMLLKVYEIRNYLYNIDLVSVLQNKLKIGRVLTVKIIIIMTHIIRFFIPTVYIYRIMKYLFIIT